MLRIHFTGDDWANTRIAETADPLWELSLSTHQLRLGSSNLFLHAWKQRATLLLHPSGTLRAEIALLLALNPPRGYFPDFLTPYESGGGLEAGIEAVQATPKTRLRREIGMLGVHNGQVASAIAGAGRGEKHVLNRLGEAMHRYHRAITAPQWEHLSTAVATDRAQRARNLADGGWANLFDNLHPSARFHEGKLEIASWGYARDRDLHLAGRGLLIIPSYFKEQRRQLMVLADGALPPVLIYPIDVSARWTGSRGQADLAALIGRTRAHVLEAVAAKAASTSAVAGGMHITVPAASKHLTVLRNNGLVSSSRERNAVIHTLTSLGRRLLTGDG